MSHAIDGRFHVIYMPLSYVTGLINLSRELAGFRAPRIDRQKSIVCLGRFTTFFQYSRKEGEMYHCTGVPSVQKVSKTKNENEAIRRR